jgi:hypothetical protein
MAGRVMITVPELCKEMHKGTDQVYAWARRKVDPLPVRYVEGERYGAILVNELDEWWRRNGVLMNERG